MGKDIMNDSNIILLHMNREVDLNSPQKGDTPQLNYFDQITQRLDSWEAKRLSINQHRAQLIKTMLVKEIDPMTNITKTFRLTCELISTEKVDIHAHQAEQSFWEMEDHSYVS